MNLVDRELRNNENSLRLRHRTLDGEWRLVSNEGPGNGVKWAGRAVHNCCWAPGLSSLPHPHSRSVEVEPLVFDASRVVSSWKYLSEMVGTNSRLRPIACGCRGFGISLSKVVKSITQLTLTHFLRSVVSFSF